MITEYNRINSKLARANSEFKIEKVENKFENHFSKKPGIKWVQKKSNLK